MGYAYSALSADAYTMTDSTGLYPWPTPFSPPPPYPPDWPPYDPDDLPDTPENPDGVNTWRFRHIVRSINQRRNLFGVSACGLSYSKPDADVTYTEINTARGLLEGMCDNANSVYFLRARSGQLTLTSYTGSSGHGDNERFPEPLYLDYNDLLSRAKVGQASNLNITAR